MQLADGIEDFFPGFDGELRIGGVPVSKLAEEFGTPFSLTTNPLWGGNGSCCARFSHASKSTIP